MTPPTRRSFLVSTGLFAGGAAALRPSVPARAEAADEGFRLLSHPVLTNPAPDAVTVLWATSAPATGWVEYGPTAALGSKATGEDDGLLPYDQRVFKFRLTGLKPGTTYYYRVHSVRVDFRGPYDIRRLGDQSAASETYEFRTPAPDAKEVRFTVWNDTHETVETLQKLCAVHETTPADFLLWNGDQTNDVSTEDRMIKQFLAPGGRQFAARVPYYYARGNHDVRGPGARNLPRVTDVPGAYYYSFRRGPLAAIVLDTGEDKPDAHPVYGGLNDFAAFRSRQAEWLAAEVEKPEVKTAPVKLLFCHIPLWTTREGGGCLDGRAKWHDLLVKAGVQLVVSGHTHRAAWLPPDKDRPYGQLIAGGPRLTSATYTLGHVTADGVSIRQHKLDGELLHAIDLPGRKAS